MVTRSSHSSTTVAALARPEIVLLSQLYAHVLLFHSIRIIVERVVRVGLFAVVQIRFHLIASIFMLYLSGSHCLYTVLIMNCLHIRIQTDMTRTNK